MKKANKKPWKKSPAKAEVDLQNLIIQKTRTLSETTIANGGLTSPEQLSELDQLTKLANLSQKYPGNSRPKRWLIVGACLLSLALVTALFFLRVSKTEIELEAQVSELSFRLPNQQVLSNVVTLQSLGISDAHDIELPKGFMAPQTDPSGSMIRSLQLSIAGHSSCQGSITLESIVLPKNTQIWIRQSGKHDRIRLSLRADGASLRAAVDGCVVAYGAVPGAKKQLNYPTPKAIVINLGANDADIDIEFNENAENLFVPFIQANNIDLFRVEQLIKENGSIIRQVSTISAGKIYFQALADESLNLRAAEPLSFIESEGELRSIALIDNHLAIQYHGEVSGMTSGSEKNPRNLMPSYLDWLKANHSLSLLWGSVIYLIGLILSLMKGWEEF